MVNTNTLLIYNLYLNSILSKRNCTARSLKNGKEDFIQEYCNMGQDYFNNGTKLKSTPFK